MSTAAFRNNPSFTRQHIRTSATSTTNGILPSMTNDRSKYPFPNNPKLHSTPSVSRKLSSSTIVAPPPLPSASQVNESSKQPYTFSNPPRELQRQSIQPTKYLRHNRSRQRVSSAPDENSFQISPLSVLNQQKPSSANESSTPRSHNDKAVPTTSVSMNHLFKRNEQEKSSLNDLMKKQERSKVPKAVQNRRIILLFRRLPGSTPPLVSPRQHQNASPIRPDMPLIDISQVHSQDEPFNQRTSPLSDSPRNDPFHCIDQAEIADSKQLAAILANIQSLDDWIPYTDREGSSPRRESKSFDPKKYEYVAKNSLDTTTFKLSPRTLKPAEELAARSRFSQNYRYEMLSSANAQIPPLMASIVTENNNTVGSATGSEKTFTFRLNPGTTMKKPHSLEEIEPLTSAASDSEQVQLCFDEILRGSFTDDVQEYVGNDQSGKSLWRRMTSFAKRLEMFLRSEYGHLLRTDIGLTR